MTCSGVNMEVNADHYHKLVALMRRSSNLALQGTQFTRNAAYTSSSSNLALQGTPVTSTEGLVQKCSIYSLS
jgi:hypothetical protein